MCSRKRRTLKEILSLEGGLLLFIADSRHHFSVEYLEGTAGNSQGQEGGGKGK